MQRKKLWIGAFYTISIVLLYKMLQVVKKTDMEEITVKEKFLERSETYYKLTYEWLNKKMQKKSITDYFERNNIRKIAVYGKGSLGEFLYQELRNSGIIVVCFIDQCSKEMLQTESAIPVVNLEEFSTLKTDIDTIVITPIHAYDSIVHDLSQLKNKYRILSLEDIIYEY